MNIHELRDYLAHPEPTPGFTKGIIDQVWSIVNQPQDQAVYRKAVQWITVDGSETLDADDAIWCHPIGRWKFRVYVSITDISEIIKIFSPVDLEAMIRATSIYLSPGVIPMIHEQLSNEKFSLNWKTKHITLTTQFDVDIEWRISNISTYESLLTHEGKYTHDEFFHESQNPDSNNAQLISNLFEVARRLNLHRGANFWERSMDEATSSHDYKVGMTPGLRKVHKMIEVLMVTVNQIIAWDLSQWANYWIYRQHHNLKERAFYTPSPGRHVWLSITSESWWYTHFTSPLRRFADLMVHRMIKAKLRWEPLPYSLSQSRLILEYQNRRVFEINVLQDLRKNEKRGTEMVQKIFDRKGIHAWVHDLKLPLRRMAQKDEYKLPQAIRKRILADLEDRNSKTWQWAVGILLLGNDYEVKAALRREILEKNRMRPGAFLNSLAQTRLILWEKPVFYLEEPTDANIYTIQLTLPDGYIIRKSFLIQERHNFNILRWKTRKEVIEELFWYYMSK